MNGHKVKGAGSEASKHSCNLMVDYYRTLATADDDGVVTGARLWLLQQRRRKGGIRAVVCGQKK